MGTLASGSIDLKSLKVAGDGANKYITTIDSNGIQIHAENNASSNYTQIDTNGMQIYQNSISIAKFGTVVRVGAENSNNFVITNSSISTKNKYNIPIFIINSNPGLGGKTIFTSTLSEDTSIFRMSNLIVSVISVTVNGQSKTEGTDYSVGYDYVEFNQAVSSGNTVRIEYNRLGGTADVTLGSRSSEGAVGFLSVAEGKLTIASGEASHAEGQLTTASGDYSHAEGSGTKAAALGAHAEGRTCHAEAIASHAEGSATFAQGEASHAQNTYTVAKGASQTAIGRYNYPDTTDTLALMIGNGTDSVRSNALTVDWNGNVDIASGAKYKINGTALAASDVGAVPTTRTVNGKALSANIADADYITSTGAESGFYWRKWNSETVEAWGIKSFNATAGTAWGNMYYYDFSITIPSGIFSAAPLRGIASCNNLQWIVAGVSIISATSVKVRLVKPVSSSQAGGVYIYLYG